ncbi:MAG TPA: preprotein translocase subunit YajC [Gaiellaceae bacterium]|jgi:preprotein translocase subunit YajC|nr:preprotein translocase subunit YajC [Gaiellaceae bacterium]
MSGPGFLLIIVAFAFLYFVIVRPQKKRQLQSREMLSNLDVGAEVVTAGGIYGRVTELHDDDVMVEIAPQLSVRVARRAIASVLPPAEPDGAAEAEEAQPEEPPAVENGG